MACRLAAIHSDDRAGNQLGVGVGVVVRTKLPNCMNLYEILCMIIIIVFYNAYSCESEKEEIISSISVICSSATKSCVCKQRRL